MDQLTIVSSLYVTTFNTKISYHVQFKILMQQILDPGFNVLLTREIFCSGGYVTEVAKGWKTCPSR